MIAAFGALAIAGALIAARLAPGASMLERLAATAVLVPAQAIGLVYLLGAFHAITPMAWLVSTLLVAVSVVALLGRRMREVIRRDARDLGEALTSITRSPLSLAMVVTGLGSVAVAITSAGLLEPWAWDSLGYHLPVVHDALRTHTIRTIPTHVVYVNCYPRLVDIFFVAWRLNFADETWVELGQLPFAMAGAASIAALAQRGGAEAGSAIAGACLWLALPVVMLQLATFYVDVAVASLCLATFVLATARGHEGSEILAGVAAGVLLGSKPSAPPVVAVALLTLLVRAIRENRAPQGIVGAASALGIGVWKYLENLRDHGNPIWPAQLNLGPLRFPGEIPMSVLSSSNLPEPYLSMSWPMRVLSSWTIVSPDRWVFDMRIGGFGPLFTFGLLPAALVIAVAITRDAELRRALRPATIPAALTIVATLATPGAFWSRYTLAVPGALIALAIAASERLSSRARAAIGTSAIALTLAGLALSFGGLTDGGPTLLSLMERPPDERVTAYAIDAQEPLWRAARMRIGDDEAFGYDRTFGLPGRLARRDGRGRIAFYPDDPVREDSLLRWIDEERVRVVVLDRDEATSIARAHPERFRELFESAEAYREWQPCVIFEVLR
ncbi:MAG: hypothetical protein J0L92_20405 [Deltaproteobacteria bacterium]|nr:hypothetical protein [Deltaproteobacteria bacterium]